MHLSSMKYMINIMVLIGFLNMPALAQPDTKKISLVNENIEITLPQTYFVNKDSETGAVKIYPDVKQNPGTFLSYRIEKDSITDNEIPAFTDKLLQTLKSGYHKFTYIDDGIYLQDGKNISYIKFSSKKNGKKIFHFVFFISLADQPVIFDFSCPYKERTKWETEIESIANSTRLRT